MLGLAGVAAYLLVPEGLPRLIAYVSVTAVCVGVFAFVTHGRRGLNRASWRFFAVGLITWGAGDLVSGTRFVDGLALPFVSLIDVLYLTGHAAFIAGFLLLGDRLGRIFRIEDVLEASIVATGLGMVSWIFVIGTAEDSMLGVEFAVRDWPAILYTSADGFVVALMTILLLARRARTKPFFLTALAFVSFTVAVWVSYIVENGLDFRVATAVNAGWLLGYVLLATASLSSPMRMWTVGDASPQQIVDRARLFGLGAAILMSPAVMGIQLARGVPVSQWGWIVLGSSLIVTILVVTRMACLLGVLRQHAEALTDAATIDPVTRLANRRHLGRLLDRSISDADERGVVVFIVDIDRFAQINETFGYPVGDQVLREIGQRLVSASVSGSVVGRLGGDQFVVSMPSERMVSTAGDGAEHLQRAVSRTMFVSDINVALDATVGIVESARLDRVDGEALLQHAHVALTAAKLGHTRIAAYLPSMDHDRHDQMRLLGELETALRERQLRVFFQPSLDLTTGKVTGMEALLRWQHPREGLIGPASFLPDAERTGMLPAITAYVMEDALECCAQMRRTRPDFGVSVNLSVRNLLDPALVEQVATALQRHGLPASAVEFEVTETTAMTDPRRSVDSLVALRDLGVSIAIDDYGTGYSSLAYLRSLPVQTLKIDKSFVTAMNSEPTSASIVGSTIGLARSLGMSVIAEGVEDQITLDRLRELGCEGAQGFHIGRPVPAEQLEALVVDIESGLSTDATRKREKLKARYQSVDARRSAAQQY